MSMLSERLEGMADELHFLEGFVDVTVQDAFGYVSALYETKRQAEYAAGVLADEAGMSAVTITIEPSGGTLWKTKLQFLHASL